MAKFYFLGGTDTDIGKTHVMQILIRQLQSKKICVAGLKPIASGCENTEGRLTNSDARSIQDCCDFPMSYSALNPFTFEPAIAPHIAAKLVGCELSVQTLNKRIHWPKSEVCLVEGAGGWLTPLNETETYADWVADNQLEVILVIGMKIGCLNHTQLTLKDIQARGLRVAGWIANQCQAEMSHLQENLDWLQQNLKAPYLGLVPYSKESLEKQAEKCLLDIERLL